MPIRINGSGKQSIHSAFWNALTKDSNSLALSQLWVCGFNTDNLNRVGAYINAFLHTYEENSWNTGQIGTSQSDVNSTVAQNANWDSISPGNAVGVYLWAQGVSFIGDGLNISRIGSSQVGATKAMISDGRNELTTANITFLESNVSFVDGFLRPWSVLVGHRSLKDPNLRCDIELFALEKWSLFEPLKVRKAMLFKNAVPVNIDAEELNYTGDKLIERQVQFAFDRYEMRVYPDISKDSPIGKIGSIISLGTKKYDTITSETNKPSLLQNFQDLLGKTASTLSQVQGAASDIASVVAQGLNVVGMDNAANKVSNINRRFQSNTISPIGSIIGTGQKVSNIPQNIGSVINKITGNQSSADQVTEQIKNQTKESTQK